MVSGAYERNRYSRSFSNRLTRYVPDEMRCILSTWRYWCAVFIDCFRNVECRKYTGDTKEYLHGHVRLSFQCIYSGAHTELSAKCLPGQILVWISIGVHTSIDVIILTAFRTQTLAYNYLEEGLFHPSVSNAQVWSHPVDHKWSDLWTSPL